MNDYCRYVIMFPDIIVDKEGNGKANEVATSLSFFNAVSTTLNEGDGLLKEPFG